MYLLPAVIARRQTGWRLSTTMISSNNRRIPFVHIYTCNPLHWCAVLHVSMTWKRIGNLFWASFVLASQVSCQTREDQKLVTEVDLTRVDFSDQDESATLAMGALMEDIDRRLFQLFEKTKTAECRQKIAQHYGYFTKALGLEKPLPFSEIAVFNNTCDDEYPWDFDNLPEGVVSQTSMLRSGRDSRTSWAHIAIWILCSTLGSSKIGLINPLATKVNTSMLVKS